MNNKLPKYFRDMFKFNHELHDIVTRNHDCLHLYPTRTSGARNVLRHHIPELLNKFPQYLIDRIKTHSIYSFAHQIKCYLVDLYSYACNDINCYVCNYTREWQIAKAETCMLWLPRNQSLVIHVAYQVIVTSAGADGVIFTRFIIYFVMAVQTFSLLCFHRCDFSMYRYQSLCFVKKDN